jgi:hypothetical protein
MLVTSIAIFAVSWGLWFQFMIVHPARLRESVDRHYGFLRRYGLSFSWMQRLEKGPLIPSLVGLTTFIALEWVAVLLRPPTALTCLMK